MGGRRKLYKTWAEIDLGRIRRNVGSLRRWVGRRVKILTVIKADAYGHGMARVADAVLDGGADWLGVSNVYEALALRATHSRARIMILSAGMAGHAEVIVENGLVPVICSLEMLRAVAAEAGRRKTTAEVHVIVDTGMGRIGVWHEHAPEFIRRASSAEGVRVGGILSHFSRSDDPDSSFTLTQLERFRRVVEVCGREGLRVPLLHIANSGAILNFPESHFDMVRPGISIYGVYPSPWVKKTAEVRPAMTLKTEVCYLKRVPAGRPISYGRTYLTPGETAIATVPVGYGDGYSRLLSNRGEVLIRGRRAPVVGCVTMDQTMVDVGGIPDVRVGDEVVLIGSQGEDRISVEELAGKAGTIPYDVLCALGKQVQHRIYTE